MEKFNWNEFWNAVFVMLVLGWIIVVSISIYRFNSYHEETITYESPMIESGTKKRIGSMTFLVLKKEYLYRDNQP